MFRRALRRIAGALADPSLLPRERVDSLSRPGGRANRHPGTNLVYAATHQFGDPERNILARPFLGASGEDNRFIVDTLIRHLDPDRS